MAKQPPTRTQTDWDVSQTIVSLSGNEVRTTTAGGSIQGGLKPSEATVMPRQAGFEFHHGPEQTGNARLSKAAAVAPQSRRLLECAPSPESATTSAAGTGHRWALAPPIPDRERTLA
jgi:hypothetical protein